MHPEIKKFWSGENISFFEQDVVPPLPTRNGYLNGYFHTLYCRSIKESEYGSRYTVIAKTSPYLVGNKPAINKYEFYYLNDLSPNKYSATYSEQEILRFIRLKAFL